MLTSDFDYNLPEELIAQEPTKRRPLSRMMVLNKENKTIDNKHFFDIVDYLNENDVLVLNNTKVIPARLLGEKITGAHIEVFLLKNKGNRLWEALVKPNKRVNVGNIIKIAEELSVKAIEKLEAGKWIVELIYKGEESDIYNILNQVGN